MFDLINIFLLYVVSCIFVCYLMVIVWERNIRISEDMNYLIGVMCKCIKMLIFVLWILMFVFVFLGFLYLVGVN